MTSLEIVALTGLPLIGAGDDLTRLVASALERNGVTPRAGDVLVVAQKIVSKAEGRLVDLATIERNGFYPSLNVRVPRFD